MIRFYVEHQIWNHLIPAANRVYKEKILVEIFLKDSFDKLFQTINQPIINYQIEKSFSYKPYLLRNSSSHLSDRFGLLSVQ